MLNHWDLNNRLADRDEIWHEHMGRVGVGFYIIKIIIVGFFGLSIYFSFYSSITAGPIGMKFGMSFYSGCD